MKLVTEKGEFDSFALLRRAYLKSGEHIHLDPGHAGMNEWQPTLLHASEVGYCPRKQFLRILGAPKRVRAEETLANEDLQFWVAYRVHYLTYEAMAWAGILAGHEVTVLEPPYTGAIDAVFRPDAGDEETWLYDCKTTRLNAFRYAGSYPKQAHCLQLGAYGVARTEKMGVIEYVASTGTMTPEVCPIELEAWSGEAQARMNELTDTYERIVPGDWRKAQLPEILPESMVTHFSRAADRHVNKITLDCSWQCGWCDYHHRVPPTQDNDDYPPTTADSPCKPHWHEPLVLAKLERSGRWTYSGGYGPEDFALLEAQR